MTDQVQVENFDQRLHRPKTGDQMRLCASVRGTVPIGVRHSYHS